MGGKDKSRPKCSSPAEGGALSAAMVLPKARAFGTAQRSLFGIPRSAPHLTPWASPKHTCGFLDALFHPESS